MSRLWRRKVVRWSRRPAKPSTRPGPVIAAQTLTPIDEFGLRAGFESHEARAIRGTSSMTDLA